MTGRSEVTFDGYVHADGPRLVDGLGRPLLMRGVGLGNWLLPEGYMWRFPPQGPQSPREIEAFIERLVGRAAADAFWGKFRDAYITEADIAAIATAGFDHVRLPMNARDLLDERGRLRPEGSAPIDRLVGWCRRHRLWVILDLHGAPGGQTGTNIDDSPRGTPDLFLVGGQYRRQTVALWEQLAARYRDEPVIAAYDLLNEPLPHEYGDRYASDLVSLYKDLTAAIRAVDPHHLLTYEGTRWSTDWSIFSEVWDPNSMLQFHKYWSAPDRPSIADYLAKRNELSLPIYMGEGGENDLAWTQTAFRLYEDLGISWNHWPWKKLATWTSPASVVPPEGWADLVEYAGGRGVQPSVADAQRMLDDLLARVRLDRCESRPEVIRALFHRVPLRIAAESFGFKGVGASYQTRHADPLEWFRADDMVTLRVLESADSRTIFDHADSPGPEDGKFDVDIGDREWVEYSIDVTVPGRLTIEVSVATEPAGSRPSVELDGVELDGVEVRRTSELARSVTDGSVAPGRYTVRVVGTCQRTSIRWVEVTRDTTPWEADASDGPTVSSARATPPDTR